MLLNKLSVTLLNSIERHTKFKVSFFRVMKNIYPGAMHAVWSTTVERMFIGSKIMETKLQLRRIVVK